MTTNELTTSEQISPEIMEKVLLGGDLSSLTTEQRLLVYKKTCEVYDLDPITRPFEYIRPGKRYKDDRGNWQSSGPLILYMKRAGREGLRRNRGISITEIDKQINDKMCVVTVKARDKDGREDSDIGVVDLRGLSGVDLANAIKKAVTQAKGRVTGSLAGVGMMDESEIADARAAPQNPETHMRTLAADLVHDPRPAEMPPDVEGTPFERIMAAQTLPQLYSLTDEFAKLKVDEPTMTEIRKAFSERRDEIKAAVEDEHPAEQWVPEEEDGDGDGTE